jgi:two-component system, NtrC family, nitrogen regulation sensor histidine kinase NtrY
MGFDRFTLGVFARLGVFLVCVTATAWLALNTQWYATIVLSVAVEIAQIWMFSRFVSASDREIARFLDALASDDLSQSFGTSRPTGGHEKVRATMAATVERLRTARAAHERHRHYLEALVAHVPVALVAVRSDGVVDLVNEAARRLFETPPEREADFPRFGMEFAAGMSRSTGASGAVVPMRRGSSTLQLKVAATEFAVGGERQRLFSLQNIEAELNAQELAAWQAAIRMMTHEVMNSLTPISSLSATARDLVYAALSDLAAESTISLPLTDARDALETIARRSEGLLHFVQNHHRLTKRLEARIEMLSVRRVFAGLHRLFAADLAERGIAFTMLVEPETLQVASDAEMLDQALINLLRNAMEAVRDRPRPRIVLSARANTGGRPLIAVADNGPGVAAEHREKIFIPFFTTKRSGTGVGLTLVRQIAAIHGATVEFSETAGGGATFTLRY